jgi:hypothetical protein
MTISSSLAENHFNVTAIHPFGTFWQFSGRSLFLHSLVIRHSLEVETSIVPQLYRIRADVSKGRKQISAARRELRQLETALQASGRESSLSEMILAQ